MFSRKISCYAMELSFVVNTFHVSRVTIAATMLNAYYTQDYYTGFDIDVRNQSQAQTRPGHIQIASQEREDVPCYCVLQPLYTRPTLLPRIKIREAGSVSHLPSSYHTPAFRFANRFCNSPLHTTNPLSDSRAGLCIQSTSHAS